MTLQTASEAMQCSERSEQLEERCIFYSKGDYVFQENEKGGDQSALCLCLEA